jgi:AAA+ superfamily predicted ATPase
MYFRPKPFSSSVHDIQTLVLSYHPVIVIETVEEERVQGLLQTVVQDMNIQLFEWSITQGLARPPGSGNDRWVNECAPPGSIRAAAFDKTTDPLDVLRHIQDMSMKAMFLLKDFTRHLSDATVARQFREVAQQFSQNRSAIVLTGNSISLPSEISHDVVYYELRLPGQEELKQVVSDVLRTLRTKSRIQVEVQEEHLQTLVQALTGMTLKQARQAIAYAALEDGKLTIEDVASVLQRKAQIIREGGVLDYFPMDENPLNLGGFNRLKQWLAQARVGFSSQAHELNLSPPKGILIVGIQGCGKSLAAKAIARAWTLPLLKLDTGRLYDKYVGESEKNFRQAIALAESMAPTVLWIDEIEKSFGTDDGDADGGLSRRLFGSFLTWMQEKSHDVFVVATANDISRLPSELLRKGRFDEIFYVDLPNPQERATILQLHLMHHKQHPEQFNLPALVQATDGFSGAELEQAVVAALYRALYLKKPLDTALLTDIIQGIIPLSVSRREDLQHLRAIARERFVSVH